MPENPEFQTQLKKLRPAIERLIQQVDAPETVITGFIFSNNPKSLIRFGNNGNQGANLVKLHLALAGFAAEMYPNNPYPNVEYVDIGPTDSQKEENAEMLADELAQAVIVSGMEPTHAANIIDLASRYVVARKQAEIK